MRSSSSHFEPSILRACLNAVFPSLAHSVVPVLTFFRQRKRPGTAPRKFPASPFLLVLALSRKEASLSAVARRGKRNLDPMSAHTATLKPGEQTVEIKLAHSPDSDDAFMFYALATHKLPTPGYKYTHVLSDIQALN